MLIPWEKTLPSGPKIGMVEIKAPIMESKKWVEDLDYFQRETHISAIVIRLNTPGGGVAASQEVYEKVKNIARGNLVLGVIGDLKSGIKYVVESRYLLMLMGLSLFFAF
mgnify:CR=1 FL=1